MAKFNWSQYEEKPESNKFDWSKYQEEQPEEEFSAPKKEGLGTTLPRDIMIGLLNQRQNVVNTPYDLVKNIEEQGKGFGEAINQALPLNKYTNNKAASANQPYKDISKYLPHEQNDFAKLMGQEGNPSDTSWLIQKGIEHAPEIYGIGKLAQHLTPQRIKDIFSYGKLQKKSTGLESKINNAEQQLQNIEKETGIETNQNNLMQNKSNEELGKYLNEGANHAVRGAAGISHRLKNVENYWKGSYKNLKNELKNSQFQMENLPNYSNDMEHAINNIKDLEVVNGKFVIKNQPEVSSELQSIIDKAPKPNDTSADNFLTKYQDFRDARYDLLQRAKTATSAAERKALFKAYEDSKPIEETVSKALNEGLGPHKGEFQRVNEGYKTQVYPLRNNKIAQKALKGKLGPNTIEDLAGSGEGQELMREMIKQDPELLRNIVGQRYASKPESLKNINESTAEYLYEMPELKKIMTEHESLFNKQLEKVNQLKNKKEISLKQKIDYENQAKELKDKISRIEKDRGKIWKSTKKAAKYGAAVYLGGNLLNKIIGK